MPLDWLIARSATTNERGYNITKLLSVNGRNGKRITGPTFVNLVPGGWNVKNAELLERLWRGSFLVRPDIESRAVGLDRHHSVATGLIWFYIPRQVTVNNCLVRMAEAASLAD